MEENTKNNKVIARIENLARQRRKVLSLDPEKALDAILDVPQSASLVQSFSEEDFYFLIHDIGLEDSHPLLSLASDKQWEYIVDMEVWEKDRIELESTTRWFDLLFRVDPDRFITWFLQQKTEFMEFYLFKNIEVKVREADQDPSEFGKEFFTKDDTFYIRFIDEPSASGTDKETSDSTVIKCRDAFLADFFKRLADYDHMIYQKVLLELSSVIPAESEEEAYRLRNVRLAEKGFLAYEEAVGIYQPLKAKDFETQSTKFIATDPERKQFLPVPLYHAGMLKEKNLFTRALEIIEIDDILENIQTEFAGLCNQIIAADQKTIREKDELKPVVDKACGYIHIGLERLVEEEGSLDVERCAALIQTYPISSIFRVGYGLALELKWRAQRWQEKSWFKKEGLRMSFWGEEWLGVLGGLLIKKPLFYDNYKTGVLYREFVSIEDIKVTENALHAIMAFDDLLSKISVAPPPVSDIELSYKNFVLTLWARHYLGLAEEPASLTVNEFKRFFKDLWSGKETPRGTSLAMKASFLAWLSGKTGLLADEIIQKVGHTLENLFSELESELGDVAIEDLAPRIIHLFLLKLKT
jgi:hypothetical protein